MFRISLIFDCNSIPSLFIFFCLQPEFITSSSIYLWGKSFGIDINRSKCWRNSHQWLNYGETSAQVNNFFLSSFTKKKYSSQINAINKSQLDMSMRCSLDKLIDDIMVHMLEDCPHFKLIGNPSEIFWNEYITRSQKSTFSRFPLLIVPCLIIVLALWGKNVWQFLLCLSQISVPAYCKCLCILYICIYIGPFFCF